MVAPHVRDANADGELAPYEVVRELGSRPLPVLLARHPLAGGKPQLVVLERLAGAARADEKSTEIVKAARRIAAIANPNVSRVREIATRGDDLLVVGEYVDGARLSELWRFDGEPMPLEVVLRVLIDALNGLGALHNVRDAKQQPMKLAHGEVSPSTLLCGMDGTARLLHSVTRAAAGARAESASTPYLAPEVESGEPFDARADVFGVGVLLWEALSGKAIAAEGGARPNPVPAATVPAKTSWAKGLADVAAKALAASPEGRWATAAAMAAEIRKAAGLKLAPSSAVAAWLAKTVGEKVKARRAAAEGPAPVAVSSPPPAPVAAVPKPVPIVAAEPILPRAVLMAAEPPSPKPAPVAAVTAPKPAPVTALAAPAPPAPPARPAAPAIAVVKPAAPPEPTPPPPSDPLPRSVTVAPGIEAPVSDIIELSPESAELALESVPPPRAVEPPPSPPVPRAAPAPPALSIDIDPLAPSVPPPADAAPPAPEPVRATEKEDAEAKPAVKLPPEEPPPVSGAPLYASAIDSPPSIALPEKPIREPQPTMPSLARQVAAEKRARNTRLILGSVAILGVAFAGLLAYRHFVAPAAATTGIAATTGATAAAPTATASMPASATLAAGTQPSAPLPAIPPLPLPGSATTPDSPASAASKIAAAQSAPPAAPTLPPRGRGTGAKPPVVTAPPRPPRPPVATGGRSKPKNKPFDPNSL